MAEDMTTIRLSVTIRNVLRSLSWEWSGKMNRKVSQSDLVNAALKIAIEHPERLAELLRETEVSP